MNYLGDFYLSKAVNELKNRRGGERMIKILYLRFWGNYTLDDVGKEIGVCRNRVREIEAKALRLLKAKLRRSELSDFLSATI